jgi:hypothetical protein
MILLSTYSILDIKSQIRTMRKRKQYYASTSKNRKDTIKVLSDRNRNLFIDDSPIGNRKSLLDFMFQQRRDKVDNTRVIYFLYFPNLSVDDKIVCKIGYAIDLASRIKSIESSYKQEVIVIDAISVMSLCDETQFHRECRRLFPFLVYGDEINKSFRREMYLFYPSLYRFYSLFCSKFIGTSISKKIVYD